MLFVSRNKVQEVQSFILKVVNNNCPELQALMDGPRIEGRANLTIVVMVIPMENKRPQLGQAFPAVTKEFSTSGISLVLSEPRGLDDVLLGFRWEREMNFVQAKARHLYPMGGGFYQLGLQMTEMVHVSEYPGLSRITV